jgi:hypothetical protein
MAAHIPAKPEPATTIFLSWYFSLSAGRVKASRRASARRLSRHVRQNAEKGTSARGERRTAVGSTRRLHFGSGNTTCRSPGSTTKIASSFAGFVLLACGSARAISPPISPLGRRGRILIAAAALRSLTSESVVVPEDVERSLAVRGPHRSHRRGARGREPRGRPPARAGGAGVVEDARGPGHMGLVVDPALLHELLRSAGAAWPNRPNLDPPRKSPVTRKLPDDGELGGRGDRI